MPEISIIAPKSESPHHRQYSAIPECISWTVDYGVGFAESLFKTHRFRENLAFSICSLFRRVYAINTCYSLGKIKTQKKPAIKDWIVENKKNGRGERSAEPSSVISLFQQIYPLKYAFYLWSTLWSSDCYCDLPNIAHFRQKSNGTKFGTHRVPNFDRK